MSIDPVMVEHPVPFKDGYPTEDDRYCTAARFLIKATFVDGLELTIRHDTDNGIVFEGTEGRIFVSRSKLKGEPVEDLAINPLPPEAILEAWKGREPIADVASHHRALTTSHLAGIAARLGRKITWDPAPEKIEGDPQAQSFVARTPRPVYATEL